MASQYPAHKHRKTLTKFLTSQKTSLNKDLNCQCYGNHSSITQTERNFSSRNDIFLPAVMNISTQNITIAVRFTYYVHS